jgi:hypothetical protein
MKDTNLYSVSDMYEPTEYSSYPEDSFVTPAPKKKFNTNLIVGAAAAVAVLYLLTTPSEAEEEETTTEETTTTTTPTTDILTTIEIPSTINISVGDYYTITATCKNQNNQQMNCPGTLSWNVITGSSYISIVSTGINTARILGIADGTSTVTASY